MARLPQFRMHAVVIITFENGIDLVEVIVHVRDKYWPEQDGRFNRLGDFRLATARHSARFMAKRAFGIRANQAP